MKKLIHIAICLLVLVQSLAAAAPMDCSPQQASPPCHEQGVDGPVNTFDCEAGCQHCQVSQPGVVGELAASAAEPTATLISGRIPQYLPDPSVDIDHPPNIPTA